MSIYGGGQDGVHPAVVQALLQMLGETGGGIGGPRQFRPAAMQHALGNDQAAAALWIQHHPGAMQGHTSGVPSYVQDQGLAPGTREPVQQNPFKEQVHQGFPGAENPSYGGGRMPNAREKLLQILMQRRQQMSPPQPPGGPAYGGPFDR